MKLNAAQSRKVEEQLGIQAIDEEHPVTPKLKAAFGDHTFFVDAAGLNVIEPNPSPENATGNVVKLASWNEDRTALRADEPEILPVSVELPSDDADPAA